MDSSFLFIPIQFKLDIFEELNRLLNRNYVAIVLKTTVKEIKNLANSKSFKIKRQAQLVLKIAQKCQRLDVDEYDHETPDDVIVRIATCRNLYVATNDKKLRERLREKKITVIFLRQKTQLDFEGVI